MTQINELLDFLRESVTPFHAVRGMCKRLEQAGFESVERFNPSAMVSGHGYFMTRQGSSLVALRAGAQELLFVAAF